MQTIYRNNAATHYILFFIIDSGVGSYEKRISQYHNNNNNNNMNMNIKSDTF